MPVPFTITREDLLRGQILEPRWYQVKVRGVTQTSAKTDGSTNTVIDLVVTEKGKAEGVPLQKTFSEKAPSFAINFIEAVTGKKVPLDGGTFDLAGAAGKEVMAMVKTGQYQGRGVNQVEDFRPVGS